MMDIGTIGGTGCETSLNLILIAQNDDKLVSLCMSKYMRIKGVLAKLKKYVKDQDRSFYMFLLNSYREREMAQIEEFSKKMPEHVFTHFRCCVVALFRRAAQK